MTNITPRRETFCQAMLTAKDQSEAYRVSFSTQNMLPATIHSKASILMADGKVKARIAELRAPVILLAQYGLSEAMLEAKEAFQVAKGRENGGAMVAAVQLRAKLNGLLINRLELAGDPKIPLVIIKDFTGSRPLLLAP